MNNPGGGSPRTVSSCSDDELASLLLRTSLPKLYFQKLPTEIFQMVIHVVRKNCELNIHLSKPGTSHSFPSRTSKYSLAAVVGRKNNTQLSLLLVGDDGLHIESYCWDESTPKLVEHSHIACHLSRSEYICSFQHGYLVLFSTVCIFLFDIENAKLIATEVIPRFHFSLVPSASIHILDDRKSSSSGRFEIYLSDQNGVLFWSVELPQGKLLRITHFKSHQLTITLLIGPIINPHVELLALKDSTSAVGSYRYLENFAQMRNMKLLLRIDDDLCVSLIDLVSRTVQRIVSDDASVLRHQFPSTKVPSFVGSWKLGTSSALGPCLDPVTARPFLCVYSYRTRKFSRLDHVPLAFFGAPIYFAEEDERYVVIWDKEIIKGCRKMTFWKF